MSRHHARALRIVPGLLVLLTLAPWLVEGGSPVPGGDPPGPVPPRPAPSSPPPERKGPDLVLGGATYRASCAECHGSAAEGLKDRGPALRENEFIRRRGDGALLEFLRKGRSPGDPDHRGPARMPGRGGNTYLPDLRLRDVVAYLRRLQ